MLRSSSKSSFGKKSINQKYNIDQNKLFLKRIEQTISQASQNLAYVQFEQFYQSIIKSCIQKSQVQKNQVNYIQFFKRLTLKFKPNLQISVRLMILQVLSQSSMFPEESLNHLIKIKYMIIDTDFEYLLSKVFILEAKVYEHLKIKDLQYKSLKKCIQFAQSFVVQFLKQKEFIRKQISQNVVISYFQLYKIKKQQNPRQAQQFLNKAYRATQKSFGDQSQINEMLSLICNNHKNVLRNLGKRHDDLRTPSKAITEIVEKQVKKNVTVIGFYSWEDEKIVVQMIKNKNQERKLLSGSQYSIKLDMDKINKIRNAEWFQILHGQISILEDEILKVIRVKQQNTVSTRIGLRTISREQIIKKDSLSSSSEDASFIQKQDFNFIRKLGRAQSAKRQQNT